MLFYHTWTESQITQNLFVQTNEASIMNVSPSRRFRKHIPTAMQACECSKS